MSTQETTTNTEAIATKKKVKADKKTAKTKKAATPKKAKAAKAKGTRSGSKAAIVLDLMKRKEGATLAEIAEGDRLAKPQHSRICQRACDEEAGAEGRVHEEPGGGADVPNR